MPIAQTKKKPSILAGKAVEDILKPKPCLYHIDEDHAIAIYPMCDGVLMLVGDALDRIVATAHSVTSLLEGGFRVEAIVAMLPTIVKACVPEVTRLVSAVTGVSEESVASWQEAHKIGILAAVLEAEDVPLLIKNAQGLAAPFKGLPAPEQAREAIAQAQAQPESTEAPATNS